MEELNRIYDLIGTTNCGICERTLKGSFVAHMDCVKTTEANRGELQQLEQMENILSIAADTDKNLKKGIQSMIEILDGLERRDHGKEEKENGTIRKADKDYI